MSISTTLQDSTQYSSNLFRYETSIEAATHLKRSCRIGAYFRFLLLFPSPVQVLPLMYRRAMLCLLCADESYCTTKVLIVHAVSGLEAEYDGSFHARPRMLPLQCGAVLSALPHDVRLLAKVQREYHSSGVLALVVGA